MATATNVAPLDTPLLPLLRVTFESIAEVFLLCVAGYILAKKGILDKKTQKQLNRVNVSIFTPSLLFSKVAFFLSPAKLRELWIVPFVFLITTLVSMGVAYFLGTAFRLKRSQRAFAMAAAMFMNSNSLPIALMQSLVITVPGLKWGEHDDKNQMIGRALTYLVLHSTLGMVLRWSYGVRLLAQADDEVLPEGANTTDVLTSPLLDRTETAFPPAPAEEYQVRTRTEAADSYFPPADPTPAEPIPPRPEWTGPPPILVTTASNRFLRPAASRKSTGVFHSWPTSPEHTPARLPSIPGSESATDVEDEDEFPEPIGRGEITAPAASRWQARRRRIRRALRTFWRGLLEFMTAPLWAALLSLIVALVQPLQHTLDVHLPPVKNALNQAGHCSIPITLIVLGAYFYRPPDLDAEKAAQEAAAAADSEGAPLNGYADDEEEARRKRRSQVSLVGSVRSMLSLKALGGGGGGRKDTLAGRAEEPALPGETNTVIVAVLSRMLITPLLLLPAMAVSAKFDWHEVFADPVFVVSNVLLIASPPALTLAQITQAASGDAFERLISRTIFWSYCIVTPPSTIIFVVIGLLLSKL